MASRKVQAGIAFVVYYAISFGLFGVPVILHLSTSNIGWGVDPGSFIWCLGWWPHAISQGIDPFVTDAVWAPQGQNLAAVNCVPGASLLAWPITALLGPVVAFNLWQIAAPALAAWTAFLLCRHISRAFWPSLLGGFVFGFSAFVTGHMSGHLNLVLVFLIPVAALIVLLRLEERLGTRAFLIVLTVVLVFQTLLSLEILVTFTFFAVIAMGLAVAFASADRRRRLFATGLLIVISYAATTVVVSPLLLSIVRAHQPIPVYTPFWPSIYSSDLLNFGVPTSITRLGHGAFASVASTFSGNQTEQTAYVGLPLLALFAIFGIRAWRSTATKVLVVLFPVICVASLGPDLRIAGQTTVAMPWKPMTHVPVLKYVLPGRFMLYAFLVVALVIALALAKWHGVWRWVATGLAILGALLIVPNTSAPYYKTVADTPAFFADGTFRSFIPRDAIVLVIPYAGSGNSMLWQAQADYAFRMPEGNLSVQAPPAFGSWTITDKLNSGQVDIADAPALIEFLTAKDVTYVVVVEGVSGPWEEVMSSLGVTSTSVGGVDLYRIHPRPSSGFQSFPFLEPPFPARPTRA